MAPSSLPRVAPACGARAVRCCASGPRDSQANRRAVLLAALPLLAAAPARANVAEPEPFLKSTGARGFLAEEEEAALQLRMQAEGAARAQLERDRSEFEAAARNNQRGLCDPLSLSGPPAARHPPQARCKRT